MNQLVLGFNLITFEIDIYDINSLKIVGFGRNDHLLSGQSCLRGFARSGRALRTEQYIIVFLSNKETKNILRQTNWCAEVIWSEDNAIQIK